MQRLANGCRTVESRSFGHASKSAFESESSHLCVALNTTGTSNANGDQPHSFYRSFLLNRLDHNTLWIRGKIGKNTPDPNELQDYQLGVRAVTAGRVIKRNGARLADDAGVVACAEPVMSIFDKPNNPPKIIPRRPFVLSHVNPIRTVAAFVLSTLLADRHRLVPRLRLGTHRIAGSACRTDVQVGY